MTEISPVKYPWIRQKDGSAQWMPKIEEPITILRLTELVTAKFLRSFHCIRAGLNNCDYETVDIAEFRPGNSVSILCISIDFSATCLLNWPF